MGSASCGHGAFWEVMKILWSRVVYGYCITLKIYLLFNYSGVSDSCNPMACIAHQVPLSMGILQARTLEWAAMPSPRGSSQPRH